MSAPSHLAVAAPARDASRESSRSRKGRKKGKKKGDRRNHGGGDRDRDRGRDRGRGHGHGSERGAPPPGGGGAPPPMYGGYPPAPYGYGAPPYGYPGHPGMHMVPYGGHMHSRQMAASAHQSSMGDEGVSMQVSEKFLMRNDYCQTYVDSGLRPQNYIRDLDYANRYSEYPKIERLIKLKDEILAKRATPALSLKCDLKEFDLTSLGTKFDVILIDPPWEEYQSRVVGMYVPQEDLSTWTLDELRQLKVGEIADNQSFCFLWCGESHLEHGRELLKRWGFRRVEDICWVKTNRTARLNEHGKVERPTLMYGDTSILQRTKEQCLVGVKGTLKRSVDTHFIHANCDVDLIMEEEKEFGSTQKPTELYETIEHFCLGRRRLELFGLDRNLRDGWLTLGRGLTTSNWNKKEYLSWFDGDKHWPEVQDYRGGKLLGSIPEIDALRPKSPVRPGRARSRSRSHTRRGGRRVDDIPDEEKPLPEDLGEMAPPLPKEDEDGSAMPPMPGDSMKYK